MDNYDTSIESAPVTFKNDTTIKTEVKTEEELHIPSLPSSGAAVNYNNCTVNVFCSGNTPYPQPFPLPPYYYCAFMIRWLKVDWIGQRFNHKLMIIR